jgi:hypothetical protein
MIFPQDGLCYLMQLSTILALNSLDSDLLYTCNHYLKFNGPLIIFLYCLLVHLLSSDLHNTDEILLKVVLNTITLTLSEHDLIHTEVLLTLHNQKVKNQILC